MNKISIIGIGQAGVAISKLFMDKYPEYYKSHRIDTFIENKSQFDNQIDKQFSMEDYENNYQEIILDDVQEEIILVLSGIGKITGIVLKFLNQFKNKKINILYIKSNLFLKNEKLRENLVFQVLQEYARSGLFVDMCILSNDLVEKLIDNISIKNYYEKINNFIVDHFHMIQLLKKTKPLFGGFEEPSMTSRISTLGLLTEDFSEKFMFELNKTRELEYYFLINFELIKNEMLFLTNVKNMILNKSQLVENCQYGIYDSDYNCNYLYVIARTPVIQSNRSV